MTMRRRLAPLTLLAAAFLPSAAVAHAFLDHAVPAVGSTEPTAPPELRLLIATGEASVDPQTRAEMVLKMPPLTPGHYRVSWHAVSVDTHRTEGTFSFDIQP